MKYTGVTCSICGQQFQEQDDVVVCPDCGTPYHRSCYKEKGKCIMDDLHAQGAEWVDPRKAAAAAAAATVAAETIAPCPRCGHPNHVDHLRCENCGYHLRSASKDSAFDRQYQQDLDNLNQNYADRQQNPDGSPLSEAFGRIDINSNIQRVSVRDIIAFTQKNASYFVRLFKLMSMEVSASVFNWSALFFGPFYYLYRKMYRKGSLLLLIELATFLPSFAVAYHLMPQVISNPSLLQSFSFNTSGMEWLITLANIVSYIPWIIHIYCGFTANKSYFKYSMERLKQISDRFSGNRPELEKQILRQGGVSPVAVCLGLLGSFALFVLISIFITIAMLPYV